MEIIYPILKFICKALFQGLVFSTFIGILAFIFKENIKSIIQYSVKYYFDTKLEDYKSKETKRQKAILIADLISEWISSPQDIKKLNRLSFEAFVWLPKDTAEKLSAALSHQEGAPDVKTIISDVRKMILGANEAINAELIIHFPKEDSNK